MKMKVLITGAAGFIGYHLSKRLIQEEMQVVGLDNINDYYSVDLKYARLKKLGFFKSDLNSGNEYQKSRLFENFTFIKCDLSDREKMEALFEEQQFDTVINLAAQAGVRYSLKNPHVYTASNIEGFLNILEGCRHQNVRHLIFASSSSVYGSNSSMPFEVLHRTDHPVSLYAATKKANELMAHSYSHLYGIPCTGLRFFTVYGPLGRPDMAYFKFANLINAGKPIDVYNNGEMARDFTYIDDITESIYRLIPKPPLLNKPDPKDSSLSSTGNNGNASKNSAKPPYHLFNIGNGSPVNLMDFIKILENKLGMKAGKNMMPMQAGDVKKTWADVTDLYHYIHYRPQTDLEEGLTHFANWYKNFYVISKNQEKEIESETLHSNV